MKAKVLFIMMAIFLAGSIANAQDEDAKFGDNPDKCRAQLSTYDQFYNQDNYKDAYPAWSWCFKFCPQSTKNIYIQGPKILEYKIANAEGDQKEAYIDTLLQIYDQRIEYFGEEGKNKGRKAIDIMQYRPGKAMQAFRLFEEAIALDSILSEVNTIGRYMQLSTILYKNNALDAVELIEIYAQLVDILGTQIEAGQPAAVKAKEQIDAMIINTGVLDCDKMVEIFTPMFEENPDDEKLLKVIQNMMEREKCFSTELYAKVSEKLYENDKSASTAHTLAQYFFKNNQSEKAESYYKEAIELQEDESKKADLYFEMGLLYFNQMDQYSTAKSYALKAISADANYGKAYKLIAQIYAKVANDCGENDFEKRAVNWAIVDKLLQARSVDPSIAEDVNEMISRYSARFPKKDDAFFYGITEGQSYEINCWINETTTVRFND
jgi:tetratricopeptide (TPR) repeat protein